jgi:protein O-GlcNAc transferase
MAEVTIEQAMTMAVQHHQAGRLVEADAIYKQVLARQPNYADALHLLGMVAHQSGRNQDALELIYQAIRVNPNTPIYHNNLGNVLVALGKKDEARCAYRSAIEFQPDYADAYNNLGNVLKEQGRLNSAIEAYREALRINPEYFETLYQMGTVLHTLGRLDEAIAVFQRALELKPDIADVWNDLGNVFKDQGQIDAAIAAYQTALKFKPDYLGYYSNILYTLHFHSDYDARAIYEEHVRWNRQHAAPLKQFIQPHSNNRDPERPLRIGYVSPEFRRNVVGWNVLPLLQQHCHEQFKIFCYSGVLNPDSMTQQIRSCADEWRNISTASDERTAQMIRNDGIDILVDLTLHMAHNRLLVFARKPAPIQVTWLGYCSTTGLEVMDYRLSDPYLDPPDTDLSIYSEQTLRLPDNYWCYQPGDTAPDPAPPPALSTGYITFGCLNNFTKVSPAAMDLWTQILHRMPQARLIVHSKPGAHLKQVRARFVHAGFTADRLEFVGQRPSWLDYINTYNGIDLALDPFPYCGWITTCDSLWMGVPVVSLSGRTAAGRGGKSILTAIGLPELVAETPEQYVQIAVKLAGDLSRLVELRKTLRQRMQSSPLMDAKGFARNIEDAYRDMWRKWCGTSKPPERQM